MELIRVDPHSLKDDPDRVRQLKSSPQSDALLFASIKAVVKLDPDGGSSYIIVFGHRRAAQAVAAELSEIPVWLPIRATISARCSRPRKTLPASSL